MRQGDGESRVLRPGEDYSLWPHMKWARAQQLISELYSSVNLQSVSSRTGLDVEVSEDRTVATFKIRKHASAPIHEWSLLLGDILHNYRSALDALTWELAHLDGSRPNAKSRDKIAFPLCKREEDWRKKADGVLSTVPDDVLERLYRVQPLHWERAEDGIFVILHALDIADKHKGLLRAGMSVRDQAAVSGLFRYSDEVLQRLDEAPRTEFTWLANGEAPREGAEVFRVESSVPFESAETDVPLPLELYVEHGDQRLEVFSLLNLIEKQTQMTFEVVSTGNLTPPE